MNPKADLKITRLQQFPLLDDNLEFIGAQLDFEMVENTEKNLKIINL